MHVSKHSMWRFFPFTGFTGKDLSRASVWFQVSEISLFLPYLIQSNPHFLFLIQSLRKGKKLEQRTPWLKWGKTADPSSLYCTSIRWVMVGVQYMYDSQHTGCCYECEDDMTSSVNDNLFDTVGQTSHLGVFSWWKSLGLATVAYFVVIW